MIFCNIRRENLVVEALVQSTDVEYVRRSRVRRQADSRSSFQAVDTASDQDWPSNHASMQTEVGIEECSHGEQACMERPAVAGRTKAKYALDCDQGNFRILVKSPEITNLVPSVGFDVALESSTHWCYDVLVDSGDQLV
jgi:hypothetical protein